MKGECISSSVSNGNYNSCFQMCNQPQVTSYPLLGRVFKTYGVHPLDSICLLEQFPQCMLGHNFIQWPSNSYISPNMSAQQHKIRNHRPAETSHQGQTKASCLDWTRLCINRTTSVFYIQQALHHREEMPSCSLNTSPVSFRSQATSSTKCG